MRCEGINKYHYLRCTNCGSVVGIRDRCRKHTCVSCQKKRFNEVIDGYGHLNSMLDLSSTYFALFTLKNVELEDLKKGIKKIRNSFDKLRSRSPYRKIFAGGYYSVEVTLGKDWKWNIHIHAVIDSAVDLQRAGWYIPKVNDCRLASDWYKCTGDSWFVGWKNAYYVHGALNYVMKYVRKPGFYGEFGDLYNAGLAKQRMLSKFGLYYNIGSEVIKHKMECRYCNEEMAYEITGENSLLDEETFGLDVDIFWYDIKYLVGSMGG